MDILIGKQGRCRKTVNGQDISKDLETLTQRYKEQYLAAVKGDESLLNLPVIQAKALDILVSRNLLIQQAENWVFL